MVNVAYPQQDVEFDASSQWRLVGELRFGGGCRTTSPFPSRDRMRIPRLPVVKLWSVML